MNKLKTIWARPIVKENRFILPRYILVSLTSFVLGTLALWLLTDKAHWLYLISGIFGAAVSIITDFVFNEIWTFSRRRQDGFQAANLPKRLLRHILSKLVGLAISYTVFALGTEVFKIHYLISNIAGVAVSFLWNYAMSYVWVWARKKRRIVRE